MEVGSKLFLTLFRIVAVAALIIYICRIEGKSYIKSGYIVCFALITAGAAGNIIDSVFYGLIFNNPYPSEVATMFPPEGGYAALFHGKVVDMLYFPLFSFYWPEWMPFVEATISSFPTDIHIAGRYHRWYPRVDNILFRVSLFASQVGRDCRNRMAVITNNRFGVTCPCAFYFVNIIQNIVHRCVLAGSMFQACDGTLTRLCTPGQRDDITACRHTQGGERNRP